MVRNDPMLLISLKELGGKKKHQLGDDVHVCSEI